jgi:hypothetical protein
VAATNGPSDRDLRGETIKWRYRVTDFLATGGMAVAYLAVDEENFGRRVVVEVPRLEVMVRRAEARRVREPIRNLERDGVRRSAGMAMVGPEDRRRSMIGMLSLTER